MRQEPLADNDQLLRHPQMILLLTENADIEVMSAFPVINIEDVVRTRNARLTKMSGQARSFDRVICLSHLWPNVDQSGCH